MYAGRQYGKKMDANYGSIPVPKRELDPKNNSAAIQKQTREDQHGVILEWTQRTSKIGVDVDAFKRGIQEVRNRRARGE